MTTRVRKPRTKEEVNAETVKKFVALRDEALRDAIHWEFCYRAVVKQLRVTVKKCAPEIQDLFEKDFEPLDVWWYGEDAETI